MLELSVVALRWLQFAGASLLLGMALQRLYGPAVGTTSQARGLSLIAGGVVAAAAAAGLLAQVAVMAGSVAAALDPAAFGYVAFGTPLGLAHLARAVLGLLAVAVAASPLGGVRRQTGLAALGLGVCASFAWSGHAGATPAPLGVWHLAADALHVAAAGLWLGGLGAFVAAAQRSSRVPPRQLAEALAGFASAGTLAVAVLAVTGLFNAYVLIGPGAAATVLTTLYGQLLAIKLGLFAAMLGLAAVNRFHLTPVALAVPDGALRRLRLSLGLEAALGAAVLALVAVIGTLAPPAAF